jgi:hypothetical protein
MINPVVYFVLPKKSSYQFKTMDEQQVLVDAIKEQYLKFSELTSSINCFREDLLAVELLSKYDNIKWVEVLSPGDLISLKSYTNEFDGITPSITKTRLIEEAKNKYKIVSLRDCKGDADTYNSMRINTTQNRFKYVVEKTLDTASVIVYFNGNNNYCKKVSPERGDGKFIVYCDLVKNITSYYYGGVPLESEHVETILRSVFKC